MHALAGKVGMQEDCRCHRSKMVVKICARSKPNLHETLNVEPFDVLVRLYGVKQEDSPCGSSQHKQAGVLWLAYCILPAPTEELRSTPNMCAKFKV
jgi:hypothetical protein